MKIVNQRLCVYTKDVQRITGKSPRYARSLLQKIRMKLNKEEHEFVTIEEFCIYSSLKIDQVLPFLTD